MRSAIAASVVALSVLASCGGGPSSAPPSDRQATETDGESVGDQGGNVVNPQAPNQGYASVDGLEYSFDTPGGLACEVTDDEFAFSFVIGDNEVTLGGGATKSGGGWFGSLTLRIFADNAATEYSAKLTENPSAIAVDGKSISYSGPMERFAGSEDGSPAEPVEVGNGTFSATCG
ncbi:MAG TPA: hypothetical protein VGA13_13735 [Acidimicrobiales bacterium]|jgi:predicted small lipoprotein YifL